MTPATLAFAAFWSDPTLVRDFGVLVVCGRKCARSKGNDTPAGWFAAAASAYGGDDDQGKLARAACRLTAASLADGRPS